MSSGGKECELPAADSCAIMEGEDAEDDLLHLTHKSFLTKMKAYSREVSPSAVVVVVAAACRRVGDAFASIFFLRFNLEDIRRIRFGAPEVVVVVVVQPPPAQRGGRFR